MGKYRNDNIHISRIQKRSIQNQIVAHYYDRMYGDGYLSSFDARQCAKEWLTNPDKTIRLHGFVEAYRHWWTRENMAVFLNNGKRNDLPSVVMKPHVKIGDRWWRKDQTLKIEALATILSKKLNSYDRAGYRFTNTAFITFTVDPLNVNDFIRNLPSSHSKYDYLIRLAKLPYKDKKIRQILRNHGCREYDENEMWIKVKEDRNNLMTKLRKIGITDYCSIVESHASGFPHIHMVVIFDKEMPCMGQMDENDELRYRFYPVTVNGSKLDVRAELSNAWNYGFVDIYGVTYAKQVINYLVKDLSKVVSKNRPNWKTSLTNAFIWYNKMKFLSMSLHLVPIVKKAMLDKIKSMQKMTIADLISRDRKNSNDNDDLEPIIDRLVDRELEVETNFDFFMNVPRQFLIKYLCHNKRKDLSLLNKRCFDPSYHFLSALEVSYDIRFPERERHDLLVRAYMKYHNNNPSGMLPIWMQNSIQKGLFDEYIVYRDDFSLNKKWGISGRNENKKIKKQSRALQLLDVSEIYIYETIMKLIRTKKGSIILSEIFDALQCYGINDLTMTVKKLLELKFIKKDDNGICLI